MSSSTTAPMVLRMLIRSSGRLRILLGNVSASIDQLGRRFDRMRLNPGQLPFKGTDVIRALVFGEELFSHSPSPPS